MSGHLWPSGRFALGAGLLAVLLVACDSHEQVGPGAPTKSEVGRIPSYPQRPGDPAKGYDALLNRAAVTCGMPYKAYLKIARKSGADPGPQLPGRTGLNAKLPYSLTAYKAPSGVELVTSNCLLCHAATFDGQLILGLGNAFLDLTRDPLTEVEAARTRVSGAAEKREWRRWADRMATISEYGITDTVGVNSADNMTLALMAHRDPKTLAWSDRPLIKPPPEKPLPVAVPPLWSMRKKHAMFYNGEGRGDHVRFTMLAASLCTDSVEEARAMDRWFVQIRAYLATLKAPKYPYPVDRKLAERGYSLFRSKCKRCHGSYPEDGGDNWRYPNLLVARLTVGTDAELARFAYTDAAPFIEWFRHSFYGELSRAGPAMGYVAPPLDGVWATAPYLHNDSVPTLADLLESPKRPSYWTFERTPEDRPIFDPERVGWRYRTLAEGKSAAMSWDERNRIYDTGLKGYGNGGHTFGDDLEPESRRALIEYLKTL